MKNYEEFVNKVSRDLNANPSMRMMEVEACRIMKPQGQSYYGIRVHKTGTTAGIAMSLEPGYAQVCSGQDYEKVLTAICDMIMRHFTQYPDVDMKKLKSYETAKNMLMIQAIPTAGNEEVLNTIPHFEWEDLSGIYRLVVDKDEEGMFSMVVTYDLLQGYGISEEQLYRDAMEYAPRNFPAEIKSMQEAIMETLMEGTEDLEIPDMELLDMGFGDESDFMQIAAYRNQKCYGAGCIFYPGFLEQAAETLGGSFYVFPSSIHEVILMPDNTKKPLKGLQQMVREINDAEVAPKDFLSNSVYHYDAENHIFEDTEKYKKRMQSLCAGTVS